MNQLAVQRQSRPLLPELPQLFSTFSGFPTIAGLRSFFDGHAMRLEDETKDGYYEVRAELPGVDPTDDIEVTVHDGRLTIKAERTQTSESNGHSEFSYGSFARTVALPAGADEDEGDDYDDDEHDDQPQLEEAEHTEDEEQHQPVG